MKISELPNINNVMRTPAGVEAKTDGQRSFVFKNELSHLTQQNALAALTEMSDKIAQQGANLVRHCDILELKRYREMLAEFMHEAVRFTFQFKKQSTLDPRGRHRIYAIIKKINSKLEELTRQVLSGEAESLSLMEAIDDIRGMLVDLYM